jgi:putative pyruvate formate lyase activating enzyme
MLPHDSLSLEHCVLCPRRCGVDRAHGKTGFCGAGSLCVVAHYGPHFGEEPPISGISGSGTIFFSPCNLRCLFCQNHEISHATFGRTVETEELVAIFFDLAARGVHNINLVSPTPYVPLIADAIETAKSRGLVLPFVYNTNAYETRETIARLKGLIDIYLPDFKYASGAVADRLSSAPEYPRHAAEAIIEMKSQVGDLVVQEGVARSGIIVRHLVLPGNLAGTRRVIAWIREHLGAATCVSVMSQYVPLYRAHEQKLLGRRITVDEYDRAVECLEREGFSNVFMQELESADLLIPDFRREEPFEPHDADAPVNTRNEEASWN